MKKNFVILSLISLMPFLGAEQDRLPVAGAPDKQYLSMQTQPKWYNASIKKDVLDAFNAYIKDALASESTGVYSDGLLGDLITKLKNLFPKTIDIIVEENGQSRLENLVGAYAFLLMQAAAEKNIKKIEECESYLTGDLGTFFGKICSLVLKNGEPLSSFRVRAEVALRNDGYKLEFFLDEDRDNEKNDGMRYYFHSEPTQRPSMWRSLLGFGYTDKRGWLKYAFDKLKYPAIIGGLGYAGYRNRETLKQYGRTARKKIDRLTGAKARRTQKKEQERLQKEQERKKNTFWGLDLKKRFFGAKNEALMNKYDETYTKENQEIELLKREGQLGWDPNDRPSWFRGSNAHEDRKNKEREIMEKFNKQRAILENEGKGSNKSTDANDNLVGVI